MFPWLSGRWREAGPTGASPADFRRYGRNAALAGLAAGALAWWAGRDGFVLVGVLTVVAGGLLYFTGRSRERRGAALETRGAPQRGQVDYLGGRPAWPVSVVHPARFRGVGYDLQFGVFRMPTGALLACLLRLYDIPDTPFFLHRVFDLSVGEVDRYLDLLAACGVWALVLQSKGTEAGLTRRLSVDGAALAALLEEGRRHNRSLRLVSGARAMDEFLRIFEPEAEKSGCEAGWQAVERWLLSRGAG